MTKTILAKLDAPSLFEGLDAEPAPHLIEYLDPDAEQMNLFDLGILRGDGIFEATHVWHGVPLAVRLHMLRLRDSAALTDLPVPKVDAWEMAVREVVEHYMEVVGDSEREGFVKILVSRGPDGTTTPGRTRTPGIPSVWIYIDEQLVDPNGGRESLRVLTLPKEVSADAAKTAPWMLYGAKTLSYAMNMAVYREVARRGADNAVFYSTEGLVLEGPTSSVVWRAGDEFRTASPDMGILHGTSQQEFYAYLNHEGLSGEYGRFPIEDLRAADQAWIMGGSTLHPVESIDGRDVHTDLEFTRAANLFLRTQREYVESYSLAEYARIHGRAA